MELHFQGSILCARQLSACSLQRAFMPVSDAVHHFTVHSLVPGHQEDGSSSRTPGM